MIYTDADTYFMADVSDVFAGVSRFDIAAVLDTWQFPDIYRRHNAGLPLADPPVSEPFFNTGVLFIRRSSATNRLLNSWIEPFARDPARGLEQLSFRAAIYASGLAVRVLSNTYNARLGEPLHLSGPLGIVHRYSGADGPWEQSTPFIAEFVNQTRFNRIWIPAERRMVVMDMDFAMTSVSMADFATRYADSSVLSPAVAFLSS